MFSNTGPTKLSKKCIHISNRQKNIPSDFVTQTERKILNKLGLSLAKLKFRVVDEVHVNVLVEFTTSPGGGWWVGAGFYEINANLNSS